MLFLTSNQDTGAIALPKTYLLHIKDKKVSAFGRSYGVRVGPMQELPKAAIFWLLT